jgi:hypothetical protein
MLPGRSIQHRIGGCCAPALAGNSDRAPVLLQFLQPLRQDMGEVQSYQNMGRATLLATGLVFALALIVRGSLLRSDEPSLSVKSETARV